MREHPEPMPPLSLLPPWCLPAAGAACSCGHDDLNGHDAAASTDVAMVDWGDLLTAVKCRLCQIAADSDLQALTSQGSLSEQLLECVTALDQLQLTLAHELGRRQQIELAAFDARTALAQARVELAGTRASESKARHLALHDGLTTLPNRSHFCERLGHSVSRAERPAFAVLYLDLDGFKAVNDVHGHDAGDELLKIVAARLSRAVRSDDMVGRLGGDEFGLLLTGLDSRDALVELAAKLLKAVATPVRIGALTLRVRASVGIAVFPGDGASVDALLRNADAAMYAAKRERRGHVFFAECGETVRAAPKRSASKQQDSAV